MKNSSFISEEPPEGLSQSIVKSLRSLNLQKSGSEEEDMSCSYYRVIRDPQTNIVLFVQPYLRYKDNDPL